MRATFRLAPFAVTAGLIALVAGCSHAQRKTTPELSKMDGKKVALVDIDGEPTARQVVEVALINQLVQRGTFILVSKQDVEAARTAPDQDPMDWKGIARRAGAEYALKAKVLQFDADTHEGYSSETVDDSRLAEEQGEDHAKTEHVYKVKYLTGKVRVQLDFVHLAQPGPDGKPGQDEDRSAVAEAQDQVQADEREGSADLPPKLRFLEKISNEAFRQFFNQYN